jgi:hypothetical protein
LTVETRERPLKMPFFRGDFASKTTSKHSSR